MQIHSTQCLRESLAFVIKEYALLKQCPVSTLFMPPLYVRLMLSFLPLFFYNIHIFVFFFQLFMFKDRCEMVREHTIYSCLRTMQQLKDFFKTVFS